MTAATIPGYALEHANAYPGTLADSRPHTVWPAVNGDDADPARVIPFGSVVTFPGLGGQGASVPEPTVRRGGGGSDDPSYTDGEGARGQWGIAVHDAAHEGTAGVPPGGMVNVLTRGCVFVRVGSDVYPGQGACWVDAPEHVFNAIGGVDPGYPLFGAVFRSYAPAGGLAILELL